MITVTLSASSFSIVHGLAIRALAHHLEVSRASGHLKKDGRCHCKYESRLEDIIRETKVADDLMNAVPPGEVR